MLCAVAVMAAARAEKTFDQYVKVCAATSAEAGATLAAADASGWMKMPQSLLDSFSKDGDLFHVNQGRIFSDGERMRVLLVGEGTMPIVPGVTFRVCSVASMSDPPEAMGEDAASFAGVPHLEGELMWVWREEEGRHVAIDYGLSDEKNRALLSRGDTRMQLLMTKEKMSSVLLFVPVTDSPPATK